MLSIFFNTSGFGPQSRDAIPYIALVDPIVKPFNVPKHETITNTVKIVPPIFPKILLNATVTPVSIKSEVLAAPATPIKYKI